jgi:hypothetical protein
MLLQKKKSTIYTVHGESSCSQLLDLRNQRLTLIVQGQFKIGTLHRGIDIDKSKYTQKVTNLEGASFLLLFSYPQAKRGSVC